MNMVLKYVVKNMESANLEYRFDESEEDVKSFLDGVEAAKKCTIEDIDKLCGLIVKHESIFLTTYFKTIFILLSLGLTWAKRTTSRWLQPCCFLYFVIRYANFLGSFSLYHFPIATLWARPQPVQALS
jgi:hypothetical protein